MKTIIKATKTWYILALLLALSSLFLTNCYTTPKSPGAALPDLAVRDEDVVAEPKVAQIGKEVNFSITVVNQGNRWAGRTYIELDVTRYGAPKDVIWVGVVTNLSLKPGEKVKRKFVGGRGYSRSWRPEKNGLYIAGVSVDPEYAVRDSNRANNRAGTAVQVGIPDFEVRDDNIILKTDKVEGRDNVLFIGKDAQISAKVRNLGDGPFQSYVECEVNQWGAPAGTPPEWVGMFKFDLNKDEEKTAVFQNDNLEDDYPRSWTPKYEGMYIIAAIADPAYNGHPHGAIEEKNDTDSDNPDETKRQGNNAGYIVAHVYKGKTPEPGNLISWLRFNLTEDLGGGPGMLARSYGLDATQGWWNAYAYDQALAIIALVLEGDFLSARKVLDELEYLQSDDGYFPFAWYAPSPKGNVLSPKQMVGTNAWLLLAIDWFTLRSGQRDYVEMARKSADWILSFQGRDGGIRGGVNDKGKLVDFVSTEHNLDAYAALASLGSITGNDKYLQAARKIKRWLEQYAWNETEGRFRRGQDDNYKILDTNTWGVLVLGTSGPDGRDYRRGLQWCLKNLLLQEPYGTEGKIIKGFDFAKDIGSDYDGNESADMKKGHTGDGLDTVWAEGTLGFALASLFVGDEANYERFYNSIKLLRHPNGGVAYATSRGSSAEFAKDGVVYQPPDGFDDTELCDTFRSVAATAWLLFSEFKVNPLHPSQ